MKYLRKKEKKKISPLLILAVVLVAAVLALAAWLMRGGDTPEDPEPSQTGAPEVTESMTTAPAETEQMTEIPESAETEAGGAESGETEAQTIPKEDLRIETPYALLYYPAEWSESVRAEVESDSFDAAVKFYGSVNGREEWLFTLWFGGAEGFPAGVYQAEAGYQMDVTVSLSELDLGEGWTEAEVDALCAMQEGVNYLLEKLAEDPSFIPN